MTVKLLTEQHFEFLTLTGGCKGSSESTHVKCHIVGNLMLQLSFENRVDPDEIRPPYLDVHCLQRYESLLVGVKWIILRFDLLLIKF